MSVTLSEEKLGCTKDSKRVVPALELTHKVFFQMEHGSKMKLDNEPNPILCSC